MKRTIQVCIGTEPQLVGILHYDQQGALERSAFAYDESWLSARQAFALSPSLPLVAGPQYFRPASSGSVFPAPLADTEPDGWGRRVIQRDHAKQRQEARRAGRPVSTAPLNAVDFLLAVDDFSRAGALRFRDEQGEFQCARETGRRTAPPLIELKHLLAASQAVEASVETAADLAFLRGRGTSLGGLRPKCTVLDENGWLSIGKFPSIQDERSVTRGEVLALTLARQAGINAATSRLIDSDGIAVALIRRFDRTADGKRLMYVSAATLMGVDKDDPNPHYYTEIADALRTHGADTQADLDELWRRLAFSILITNIDDHLHNHGFLHAENGLWRLSPAFDINPFPERVRELKTWISEETGPDATIEALLSVTEYFRLPPSRARQILSEVEHAVSRWREFGRSLGIPSIELDLFADAFEHSERKAARRAKR